MLYIDDAIAFHHITFFRYSKIHVTPHHTTDPAKIFTTNWMKGDTLKWHIASAFATNTDAREQLTLRAFLHLRQWTIPVLAASTCH